MPAEYILFRNDDGVILPVAADNPLPGAVLTQDPDSGVFSFIETNSHTILTTDYEGNDMQYTISGAQERDIIIDIRKATICRYDLLLESDNNISDGLDALTVTVRPAFMNRAGVVVSDETNAEVSIITGLDLSTDEAYAIYSLSEAIDDAVTKYKYSHPGYLWIEITNVGGGTGDFGDLAVSVGIR